MSPRVLVAASLAAIAVSANGARLRSSPEHASRPVRAGQGAPVTNPEDYVNILGGTNSRFDLSRGNLLPFVGLPWSFNQWAPQSDNQNGNWWFHPYDVSFFGVRLTHQPSPWISDWGSIRIAASITDPGHSDPWQRSSYNPKASQWSPFYWNASLLAYGTRAGDTTVEIAPTNHGAILRFRFPPYISGPTSSGFNQTRRVLFAFNDALTDHAVLGTDGNGALVVNGSTTQNNGGVPLNFRHYVYATVYGGVGGTTPLPAMSTAVRGDNGLYAFLDFDPTNADSNEITVRIATSLISQEQAATAHAAQVAGRSFEQVMSAAKAAWNEALSVANVIDVGAGYTPQQVTDNLATFYSCLYRANAFPRFLTEYAANGSAYHYSPYDPAGGIYAGEAVTDVGFWDAYRTTNPLLNIIRPDIMQRMVQGWNNAFLEGGWLPKWASPGYRGSMVGTMGDVPLADAIVKGIVTGQDASTAYAAIRKDAFVLPPPGIGEGRTCLQAYLNYGYVPNGAQGTGGTCSEVVSRSINYMISDFAIANAAETLGLSGDAAVLRARAANASKLFDPSTGFFRSRNTSGSFTEPFDEFAWGGDYTEAGPWQYRFYAGVLDPQGLQQMYASAGLDLCETLQTAQTMPSTFHVGAYGDIIHEMTEMALLAWGQYEHGNQPVHHELYIGVAVSNSTSSACAQQSQYWLRRATSTLYRPDESAYVGDEDNGQMSSWYILSALGLYELQPTTPYYHLGSPLFAHVQLNLQGGKTLDIVGSGNTADSVYVSGVTWQAAGGGGNGAINGTRISYSDLVAGGTLTFAMSATPATA